MNVMGGYSYEKYVRNNKGINVKGFSTDLLEYNNVGMASSITGVNSAKSENLVISFFGRVNYAYNDKYLLTATLRRTALHVSAPITVGELFLRRPLPGKLITKTL
ncbi:hypothetical protein KUH03_07350 [Sphingobacterium sp. E70]|uniref:hypothetical protein n=1 Tax=Sphingobacterium sp. E70 TaxID=2853439 RepID=UPI00211CCAED|nr:hypothetical protein [Sphingobacterium sp. E70]ULT26650.1 hypothetical protein KUH03_07350 [Sphingobacterium sp. E70]